MERLERITYIDQILGKATKAVSSLSEALGKYSAGKIPIKLKWGVQSEDAVYNLPADATKLEEQAKNLAIQ